MRHLSIAIIATASTVAFTQIASAADLPRKAPPAPLPPSVYNWTGFYVGLNAGYGWGSADTTYIAPGPPSGFVVADAVAISAQGSASLDPAGFVGGGQIGYNWQFAPTWVLGLEADFQAFDLKDSFDGTFTTPFAGPQVSHTKVDANWLFTLRGRLGYAFDRWLVYGTGGLAVADVRFEQSNSFPSFPRTDSFSTSDTKTGWTAGGGVEYAFWNNWSAKVEYLYVDLGTISGTSSTAGFINPTVLVPFGHSTDFKANIVRAGINYKFN